MPSLSLGIVGLPNVGKSSLFNAITNTCVAAENFPFCTIDPNVGIVQVPDPRLQSLAAVSGSQAILPATVTFVDIAGLVKGASKGEGLGNKFLTNIRETSALVHVVRCFEDDDVIHVHGKVDPLGDIDTIETELLLADLDMAQRAVDTQARRARTDKSEQEKLDVLKKVVANLERNVGVSAISLTSEEKQILKTYEFLTAKPVIYLANVADDTVSDTDQPLVIKVRDYAASRNASFLMLSAKLEAEVSSLPEEDRSEFLTMYGLSDSGLGRLARVGFALLGLQTYFTTGPKETRAWTIRVGDCAPRAAAEIHTDFEKGFIRANIVRHSDFIAHSGWKGAREKGLVRQEGKDYVMQDEDVVEFLFNV
jgi:GTP-binding protein YchF